mgnify:CR=1 FL=1
MWNYELKCPVVILVDVSESMKGTRTELAVNSVRALLESLKSDQFAQRIEVTIILFNNDIVVKTEFCSIADLPSDFTINASEIKGECCIGTALHGVYEVLKARYLFYNQTNIPCLSPYLFLITRGAFTDDFTYQYHNEKLRYDCLQKIEPYNNHLNLYIVDVCGDTEPVIDRDYSNDFINRIINDRFGDIIIEKPYVASASVIPGDW